MDRDEARLEVQGLECIRGDRVLFSNLDFTLEAGAALFVEGDNGSGKTTLLRTVCGLLRPEQGTIRWCGEDIRRIRPEFQATIAYLGHTDGIKGELSVRENLRVSRALAGGAGGLALDEALQRVGLGAYAEALARTLSAGQRRRTALARLLMAGTRVWVLDEPFAALDRAGMRMVETLLEEHCTAGGLALVSSHHAASLRCSSPNPVQLTP